MSLSHTSTSDYSHQPKSLVGGYPNWAVPLWACSTLIYALITTAQILSINKQEVFQRSIQNGRDITKKLTGTEPLNKDGSPPHREVWTVKLEMEDKMLQIKKMCKGEQTSKHQWLDANHSFPPLPPQCPVFFWKYIMLVFGPLISCLGCCLLMACNAINLDCHTSLIFAIFVRPMPKTPKLFFCRKMKPIKKWLVHPCPKLQQKFFV